MKCRWLCDALFRFVDAAHDGDKKKKNSHGLQAMSTTVVVVVAPKSESKVCQLQVIW